MELPCISRDSPLLFLLSFFRVWSDSLGLTRPPRVKRLSLKPPMPSFGFCRRGRKTPSAASAVAPAAWYPCAALPFLARLSGDPSFENSDGLTRYPTRQVWYPWVARRGCCCWRPKCFARTRTLRPFVHDLSNRSVTLRRFQY